MLKWLSSLPARVNRIFSSATSDSAPLKEIIPRDQHPISRQAISDSALKVLYRLRKQGYEAYLVGGCIRDLLIGLHPKDFDVATNATPEQVRDLFRNSRIIGRRFQIVHVQFGREIIEVTTFRANHTQAEGQAQARQSTNGMLLRDNVYGSVEEDAIRRDFTINAIYYNIDDFSLHDYTHGITDLQRRLVRIIGDPEARYREDPVRMLRAVRFAAKLDFQIEAATLAPIATLAPLLNDVPSARLFDEVVKLLLSGQGEKTLLLLQQTGLFDVLFASSAQALKNGHPTAQQLLMLALRNTDARIRDEKPVTPAFIFAAMLWPAVEQAMQLRLSQGQPEMNAFHEAAQAVIDQQVNRTAIPKRFSIPMREIWELQLRLPRRQGRRPFALLENRRFRAAYDFLLLRQEAGEPLEELCQWWSDFQFADEDRQLALIKRAAAGGSRPATRRRRRPRRSAP